MLFNLMAKALNANCYLRSLKYLYRFSRVMPSLGDEGQQG